MSDHNDEYTKWLDSLKPGDEVVVETRYGNRIEEVKSITKSGNIKVGSNIYYGSGNGYKSGNQRGGSVWHTDRIKKVTNTIIEEINYSRMISFIMGNTNLINKKHMNIDDIKKIYDIMKKAKDAKEEAED